MKLNCMVIEDESIARKGIEGFIEKIDFLYLAGSFPNPLAAFDMLQSEAIDLIFLDINMPEMSGITFLKTINNPPAVIITTAFSSYAVAGYEHNVVDYLLKPFSFERFLNAVSKVKKKVDCGTVSTSAEEDFMFVKCEKKLEKIKYDDILFVSAIENYVIIQTETKKYISYLTLKSVEDFLPKNRFLKVHKSYIVSMSKINSVDGNTIQLKNHTIAFSRNNREEILNLILNNKFLKR